MDTSLVSNTLGTLTVITGPSGVGKGTVVKRLLHLHHRIWLSVSATTRSPRKGEVDGEHYFFMDKKTFLDLSDDGGFLEWAEFAGNCYGTPLNAINKKIAEGRPVLLEIELKGARQVKKTFPNAFMIFLSPPSFDELEERIRGRGTDSEESIQKRLFRAKEELKAVSEFDAVIVNDNLDKTIQDVALKMNLIQ